MARISLENPFVTAPPSPQNAIDLFPGEWASKFPDDGPAVATGTVTLFEDERLPWADSALRSLGGTGFGRQSVIELGPLEGGHTYMLEKKLDAREVIAVEANARAYLKCLIAKELLALKRSQFLLGDAIPYLRDTERTFDVGVACAFFYHLLNPVEAMALLAAKCREIFVWSVVFDPSLFEKHPAMRPTFGPPESHEVRGFRHTLHPHSYGESFDITKFLGGTQASCRWMVADDVVGALRHFGFSKLVTEQEDHLFGKAVRVAAIRA